MFDGVQKWKGGIRIGPGTSRQTVSLFPPSYNYISLAQLPGGSALESGKICKGDRVVAVGGQDVREAPVEDIAVHVKVSNPVQLKLARFKSAKK